MKKRFDNNKAVNLALLQITATLIGNGLPSPATVLFSKAMRGLLPKSNRMPIIYDYGDDNYDDLKQRQE